MQDDEKYRDTICRSIGMRKKDETWEYGILIFSVYLNGTRFSIGELDYDCNTRSSLHVNIDDPNSINKIKMFIFRKNAYVFIIVMSVILVFYLLF